MKLSATHVAVAFAALSFSVPSFAQTTSAFSFTPVSVKLPIMQIGFIDPLSKGNMTAYQCTGASQADCTVDLMDNAALAAAFGQTTTLDGSSASGNQGQSKYNGSGIDPGTYDTIFFNNCNLASGQQSKGYTIQAKGTVTGNGKTLYTASGADPLTTDQTKYDYTSFTVPGCQVNYPMPVPLTVKGGDAISVNLFTDPKNLLFAVTGTSSALGSAFGCVSGATYTLCPNQVPMVPYVAGQKPTAEAYKIAVNAQTVGELTFYLDPSGNVLGVGTRYLFDATTTSAPAPQGFQINPFLGLMQSATLNSDRSYNLSGMIDSSAGKANLAMPSFARVTSVGGTATGTMTSPRGIFADSSYTATRE